MGIFEKFKLGFKKSANNIASGLREIIIKKEIDDETLDKIEEFLISSDVGIDAASEIKDIIAQRKIDPKNQTAAAPQKKEKKEKKKEKHNPPPKKKSAEANTGAPVVQMINGEIVLEESSLMFPGQRRSVKEVEEEFDVIEEDAQLAIVGASYNSFVNRKGPQHWNVTETKQFYQALRQLGTDFTSMESLFENRTRKQLKRKYTAELSKNPKLVEMALKPDYQKDVGK